MGQVVDVPHSLVGIMKCLDMPPAVFDRVRMSASKHINETDRAIHSFVCVALRFYVPLCRPAVTDDSSPEFDPVTKNCHQRAGGLSAKGIRNLFSGLALNTTEYPQSFYFVYLRRRNLLSSISTVFLGPKIF